MTILVFARANFRMRILEQTNFKNDYVVVTDAVYTSIIDKYDYYLSAALDKYAHEGSVFFSDEELFNIVRRDRYLRSIIFKHALKLIYNVTGQLLNIVKKESPRGVFSPMPESFPIDILFRIAKRFDIKCYSFCVWAIPGYFAVIDCNHKQFYCRSQPIEDFDLKNVFLSRQNKISRYCLKQSSSMKELLKRLHMVMSNLFFRIVKLNKYSNQDVKNENYLAMAYKTKVLVLARLNLRDLNADKYYANLDELTVGANKKVVYLSLHYYPEASIDYMSESTSLIDHDDLVLEILERFSSKYIFLLKEHPAMYRCRDLTFYDKIKVYPNTYLLNPKTDYVEILKRSNVVISWGGSISLEAPFWGVRPLNVMKPLYSVKGFDNYFLDYKDLIDNFLNKIENPNYMLEDYCNALNKIFSQILFEGDYFAEYWNNCANLAKIFEQILYKSLVDKDN